MQLQFRHKITFSLLSGFFLGIPWISLHYGWILLIAWVPLLLMTTLSDQIKPIGILEIFGWSSLTFGIWNLLTTWWLGYTTISGAITLLLLNTFLFTTVYTLSYFTGRLLRIKGGLLLIFFWIGFEYTYHHTRISWPWLTLGNGLANNVSLIQWYEYTGVLGGSFWILATNLLFTELILSIIQHKTWIYRGLSLMVILITPSVFSLWTYDHYCEKDDPVRIGIIQPNINPFTQKFNNLSPDSQVNRIMKLANTCIPFQPDIIMGPETAFIGYTSELEFSESYGGRSLHEFLQKNPGISLLMGAETSRQFNRQEEHSDDARWEPNIKAWKSYYNTAVWLKSSEKYQFYHKKQLVAGIEKPVFNPKCNLFGINHLFAKEISNSLDTSNQQYVFRFKINHFLAPVICYESLYGYNIREQINDQAGFLAIITNDGWFKDSPGPEQHLLIAGIRAIEFRRSVARSANTGVSAFINQRGDKLQTLESNKAGILTGIINMNNYLTFYAKNGDYTGFYSLFFSILTLSWMLLNLIHKKVQNIGNKRINNS